MPTPPIDLAGLPTGPGVYRFRDAAGRALYIGRATQLRRRVRSYWGSQKGRPRMRRMVPQIVAVEVAVCDSEHEAAWLERNLLEQSKPRWNRARGGLEVPVFLRLDAGPRSPGLTAVHEVAGDLPHFGPYLGGTQVRAALAALGMLHPLAYTGDAMGGAERSMAQARGVTPADRAALADTLTAVLRREPAAVAAIAGALAERRDRAAKALEFELAGRLHEQAKAVEWLVSPQRITVRDGDDAVAAGWADGHLVAFTVEAGRMRRWVQRPCPREEAEPLLAATPPEWRGFAARNAELAASLLALGAR